LEHPLTTLDEKLALVRPDAPRSPGSRARSREIGYAEAMADISRLLRAEARKWKNSADAQIIPLAEAALKVAAGSLEELADYAFSASMIYGDERSGDIDQWIQLEWRLHQDAPTELGGASAEEA
jgi:hypothetical protein